MTDLSLEIDLTAMLDGLGDEGSHDGGIDGNPRVQEKYVTAMTHMSIGEENAT